MRRIPVVAVVALALAGCGRDDLEVSWATPAEGDSLELVYTIARGPELGEVDVVEDDDRVTVSLKTALCVGSCATEDIGLIRCVRVELDDPLGSREVIDAATDRPPEPIPPDAPRPEGVTCEPE